MDNVEYGVKEIVAELSGIPFASIDDSATLAEELDLDSLELVNLAQDLEEKFSVEFHDSDIRAGMTVADLVRLINSRVQVSNQIEV